jgi:hypothetical protein
MKEVAPWWLFTAKRERGCYCMYICTYESPHYLGAQQNPEYL